MPTKPPEGGERLFETDNEHYYTPGQLTKKKWPGQTFEAPAHNTNTRLGICAGMSVRWILKSIRGLDDRVVEQKIGLNGANATAKSAKAQGIMESLSTKRTTESIKQFCAFYGLDLFDVAQQPTFEGAWGDFRGSILAAEGSTTQGHYMLLEVPGHMTALKYGGASLTSRFFDPNHGLYEYASGNNMLRAIERFIAVNYHIQMISIYRVKLSGEKRRAELPDGYYPALHMGTGSNKTSGAGKTHKNHRGCTLF